MHRCTGSPSWSPSLGFTNRDDFTADRATRCPKEDSYRCHAAIWCGRVESNHLSYRTNTVHKPCSCLLPHMAPARLADTGAVQLSARGRGGRVGAAPGDDGGTRTRNLRFGMSTLCQLSYHHHVFVGTLSAGGLGEAVSSPLYEPPPRGIDILALP